MAQENDPRHLTTNSNIYHLGGETLADVASLVTWRSGAPSFGHRCSSLIVVVVDSWLGELG